MANVVKDTVTWFEIPAKDIHRAVKFYSAVLDVHMKVEELGPTSKMSIFNPLGEGGVHGALVQADGYVPGQSGSLVYLNGGEDLAGPLSRVAGAGGNILKEKFNIGPHGFIAYFTDTEGNKVALHSMK